MGKISNFESLTVTPLRKTALGIAEAGLSAIDTERVISKTVRLENEDLIVNNQKFSLEGEKRIFVVGIGKCSLETAGVIEKILGDLIIDGVVVDVDVAGNKLKKIRALQGTHPLPSEANVRAMDEVLKILQDLNEDDIVIFLISGGGSTLLCQPSGDFSYNDEANLLKTLFKSGADIREINTVRKHLSLARGGFLAAKAYPARVISLISSDIPGDDIEFIASEIGRASCRERV